jgi:RecB family exonuclease
MSAAFDTLRFARRLREAGFSEIQAEAMAEAFRDASTEALATKHDMELLRADLGARIDRVETKLTGELTLIKWMLGLIIVAEAVPWLAKMFS